MKKFTMKSSKKIELVFNTIKIVTMLQQQIRHLVAAIAIKNQQNIQIY